MARELLGYFEPGHAERVLHVEGRSHPLARTAALHEQMHESLTSWSSLGTYQTVLGAASKLATDTPHHALLKKCLAITVAASRSTHEGIATFYQLQFIWTRLGRQAFGDAAARLPRSYAVCSTVFRELSIAVTGGQDFDVDAIPIAVRSFAIAALNIDIFTRFPTWRPGIGDEIKKYLSDGSNNPDLRLDSLVDLVRSGELQPLISEMRQRLGDISAERLSYSTPDVRGERLALFSRTLNAEVLTHLQSRIAVDTRYLDVNVRQSFVTNLMNSIGTSCGFDPSQLLARWRWKGSKLPQQRRDIIEFSDRVVPRLRRQTLTIMQEFILSQRRAGGSVVAGLFPVVLNSALTSTEWIVYASARIRTERFSAGVESCGAVAELSDILKMLQSLDIPVVVVDALLYCIDETSRNQLLSLPGRLYLYSAVTTVVTMEEVARRWLGSSCRVTGLREAIDHNALVVVGTGDSKRNLVGLVGDFSVRKYEYFLSRYFALDEIRIADRGRDAEVMLVAWLFTYGPLAEVIEGINAALP